MLKKDLERLIETQRIIIHERDLEITSLKEQLALFKKYGGYSDDLTRALSITTEAVAHVLTDLKRRY